MGKRKKGNCIFCLTRPATENEHVLPKSWYPSTTPATVQFLTVPVCGICADEFEAAERAFKNRILFGLSPSNPDAASAIEAFQRSWQANKAPSPNEAVRRAATLLKISREIRFVVRAPDSPAPLRLEIPISTPAGLHIKATPVYPLARSITAKICEKLVRGLHYHEARVPLPVDTPIAFQWVRNLDLSTQASIKHLPLNDSLAPGLRYRVRREEDCSFWVFHLWGQVDLAAFAGRPPPD